MKKIYSSIIFLLLYFFPQVTFAQSDSLMRRDGRIYVVVTVVLIILLGLIGYLVRIEKKINKLTKHNDSL